MDEQQFEWDDGNVAHLARHAVSADEAEQAILDPDAVVLEIQSENEDQGSWNDTKRANPRSSLHNFVLGRSGLLRRMMQRQGRKGCI